MTASPDRPRLPDRVASVLGSAYGVAFSRRMVPARGAGRRIVGTFAAYLVLQLAQLAVLSLVSPRFFWHGDTRFTYFPDAQTQFMPTAWWLGRSASGLLPPLADPGLGAGGNFTADLQYGVFDPLHWLLSWAAGLADNLVTASWAFGTGTVLLLGAGALSVLLVNRVTPLLAVPAAIGIATAGSLLWMGSDWWPVLWSAAWLPWLLLGLSSDRWPALLCTGISVWALLAAGNPYILPFVAALVLARILTAARGGVRRLLRDRALARHALATLGGAIIAAPGLLTALQNSPYLARPEPEPILGNSGFGVPNLLDVVVGGPTLHPMLSAWSGTIDVLPLTATLLVAVPLLPLIDWRTALRSRVFVLALVTCVTAAALTQLPAVIVGGLRIPYRYVVSFQIMLSIVAVLGAARHPARSRPRLLIAGGLTVAQFLLSLSRTPVLWQWHLIGLALVALGVIAALAVLDAPGRLIRLLGAVALVPLAASAIFVGAGQVLAVEARYQADRPQEFRFIGTGYDLGTTVEEFRARALVVDRSATVLQFDPFDLPQDHGFTAGVAPGNANLFAGFHPGFGYGAGTAQKNLATQLCQGGWGQYACPDGAGWLAVAPGSPKTWLELYAADRVYLSPSTPQSIVHFLDVSARFRAVPTSSTVYRLYERTTPLTGRITEATGVQVDPADWRSGPARPGTVQESYRVTTAAVPGTLTLSVPYWPGYEATLDGAPVPVEDVAGALLRVAVPAGVEGGRLEVSYRPIGERILVPCLVGGAALIAVAGLLAAAGARRRRVRPLGSSRRGSAQPPSRDSDASSRAMRSS